MNVTGIGRHTADLAKVGHSDGAHAVRRTT
jgi:hypothetical protein